MRPRSSPRSVTPSTSIRHAPGTRSRRCSGSSKDTAAVRTGASRYEQKSRGSGASPSFTSIWQAYGRHRHGRSTMRTDGSLPAAGGPVAAVVGHGGPRRPACCSASGRSCSASTPPSTPSTAAARAPKSPSPVTHSRTGRARLLERQAEREPRLVAKMNELGGILGLVGLVALLAGLLMLSVWRVTKARERNVERAREPRRSSMWAEVLQPERAAPQRSQSMRSAPSLRTQASSQDRRATHRPQVRLEARRNRRCHAVRHRRTSRAGCRHHRDPRPYPHHDRR